MKNLTMTECEDQMYPPACRFVVEFISEHLLTNGTWTTQSQRRFVLADSAADALAHVKAYLADELYWPAAFHRSRNVTLRPCPEAAAYVGYYRFGGPADIRKTRPVIS